MDLLELRESLASEYDVEGWWPSESPFEVMVGAVLTQQTVWETVSKVLDGLRSRSLLDVRALACSDDELERIIRPTGFYNQKAQRLRAMARHIVENHDGDVSAFLDRDMDIVRKELLSLKGIGRETADSILLFGAGKPRFVAAAYVSRVLGRTGTFDRDRYGDVQDFVESMLPRTVEAYREFYALCVHHCKTVCTSRPRCSDCVLSDECPRSLR